jgi:hypothetical protein
MHSRPPSDGKKTNHSIHPPVLLTRETELLREDIRIAATWPVPANDDYERFIYEQGDETWIRAKAQRGEEHRGGVVAGDRGG